MRLPRLRCGSHKNAVCPLSSGSKVGEWRLTNTAVRAVTRVTRGHDTHFGRHVTASPIPYQIRPPSIYVETPRILHYFFILVTQMEGDRSRSLWYPPSRLHSISVETPRIGNKRYKRGTLFLVYIMALVLKRDFFVVFTRPVAAARAAVATGPLG